MNNFDQCFDVSEGSKCEGCSNNTICKHGVAAYEKYVKQEEKVRVKLEEKMRRKEDEA